MKLTYHGTPKAYYESLDPAAPYLPSEFAADGFIHCTDGREAVSIILSLLYKEESGPWVVLYIDLDRVAVPVKYEDPAGIFPHLYGPLNRDAIIAVQEVGRSEDGSFHMPALLELHE